MVEGTVAQEKGKSDLLGNLFPVGKAGELLGGIPATTVRGWIRDGRLDAVRVGRRWMITRQSLERLLREGR